MLLCFSHKKKHIFKLKTLRVQCIYTMKISPYIVSPYIVKNSSQSDAFYA